MTLLDTIQQYLGSDLKRMNDIISSTLLTSNPLMNRVVESYLKIKGKQIRPIIVILSARMFGSVNNNVLYAGAALEMLHNASLIHDDVVDETNERRGVPTINSVWGNHLAVLVGDYFVSNALEVGIRTGSIDVIAGLSRLGIELSIGEVDQISNASSRSLSEDAYFSMIRKKTASLFMNCLEMGARTSGAPEALWRPMLRYAELLGLCFQIKDDVFDYYPQAQVGKPTGNDLRENKITLPLLYALASAPEDESLRMKRILEKDNLQSDEIHELINFAIKSGGIDYAFSRMRAMQQEADAIINKYPDSEARQSFKDIFEFIIARDY